MYDITVSVIIPVYNAEKYIAECLESLLCQTHRQLEIIAVNDGSSDSSAQICKAMAEKDNRITVINKENGGPTSCRKAGFGAATGKYVYFCDADDVVKKDAIETLLALCEENGAEISACGYEKFGDVSGEFPLRSAESVITADGFTGKIILPAVAPDGGDDTEIPTFLWNHMYLASAVTPDCFVSDREYTREDTCFNLNILNNVKKAAVTGRVLYRYRINGTSLTNACRKNKLEKDVGFINFISAYTRDRNIDCGKRMAKMISGIFYGNVNNFAKSGSFAGFKAGMKKMKKEKALNDVISGNGLYFTGSVQKLTALLYNKNMYFSLYVLRKMILKVRG